ncbi:GMC family oxidoreductase [Jannaschia pohangensis]|uniref:Choline dehydrogenase n=1 Tax=Jannaschia pohangensis TaxID=390807 RepID=A0A1I3N060_9RHOB|nr:GMC family oxidoreductase N-terminal domain-containing protein [Jannaschia pohangensis]SFJ02390.1 choline dehydrogenase [Jannaschia pohangensis]
MEGFDFIIVGAGSAGCVLADKLSACGRFTVLLIEAGGSDQRFWIKVPLGYGMTFDDPRVNWCYTARADPGLDHRSAFWPRGRVIGGSSSINAMVYLQGLPDDFDDWDRAGATGWNWAAVRETYAQLETHDEPDGTGGRRLRGTGAVHVSDLHHRMHPFSRHFLAAARESGWQTPDHLNGDAREGIIPLRATVRNARRWSAADAFLRPARGRPNLRVISEALVERIILRDGVATGVDYRRGESRVSVTARREVILSAGAINSPQLLQLSGVGPAALLQSLGIEVRRNLAQVGQGLQDHLGISCQFDATEATLNNRLGRWPGKIVAALEYLAARRGPLSIPVNQIGGFVRSGRSERPDLQIYCNPMSYCVGREGKTDAAPTPGFLICAQPCRPTSRGEVVITSADPRAAPDIRPNSLATEEDRAMAIAAGRTVRTLAATPAIRAVTQAVPDPDAMTDDALLADFRARAGSVYHASCTCRMGHDARDSVLDARLRVHGVAGLRVIDASSFPNVTSGNTNAPVMMLAARGAEMILQDARQPIEQGGAR